MPTLNINTNVPGDSIKNSDILKDCSKIVASTIGKPESYVMVSLRTGVPMVFGGTEEPTAYAELISIGGLNADVNTRLSKALAEVLKSKLGIPQNRYYIKFYDVKRSDFGWNGGTF